jgi:peptidoglycan/LPS O-acetylase OafA/YrhL
MTYNESDRTNHRLFACLDGLRGFAALLIAMRHTEEFFGKLPFQQSYLAVDLFFLLSGVVIANAYEDKLKNNLSLIEFIKIRAIRLYPIYLLGTALAILVEIISGRFGALELAYHSIFSIFFIPNPADFSALYPINIPAWSLFFEFIVNIFYALTLSIISKGRILTVISLSAIGLVLCLYINPSEGLDMGWKLEALPFGLFRVFFSFYVGVYLFRAYNAEPAYGRTTSRDSAIVLLLIFLAGVMLSSAPSPALRPCFDFLAVSIVFPSIVYTAIRLNTAGWVNSLCRISGLASYPMYMIHLPLARLVSGAYKIILHRSIVEIVPWIGFIFMLLLVPLCIILDRYYDRKARIFLRDLLMPRKRTATIAGKGARSWNAADQETLEQSGHRSRFQAGSLPGSIHHSAAPGGPD